MRFNFRLVLIFVLLAMLLNGIAPQPARANLPANATLAGDPQVNALIVRAEETGPLPVIVSLNIPYQPEGELTSPQAVRSQVDRIQTAQAGLLKQLEGRPVENVKQFKHIPAMAFMLDADGLRMLQSMPEVAAISEDKPVPPTLSESVPLIHALPSDTGGFTGSGWAVAVLDTGVDKTHSFLAGKVVSEACYSTNYSYYGSTSVCPGGVQASTAVGSGVNCNIGEDCYHGTHVAGIATGKGSSFSGVARDAQIIAVQVFSAFPASYCGGSPCALSYSSDQMAGMERVYELRNTYKIASVNMSLGGGSYTADCDSLNPSYKSTIDLLRSAGIATIIATGNDGYTNAISAPACYSSAFSVGSTGDGSYGATADAISSFSNRHPIMEFFAPGQWINSSIPGGGYDIWSGTSMATPHVAGAWALLRSRDPYATVDEVYAALRDTGKPIAFSGITRPRIDVGPAVTRLHQMVKPSVGFSSLTYSIGEGNPLVTITVTLSRQYSDQVTVQYNTSDGTATAGLDYYATSGTLTFAPGETSKEVNLQIINDSNHEANETVNLHLTSPVNANAGNLSATLTINDNDAAEIQAKFAASSYTISESGTAQTVTVQLTSAPVSTVTVDYAASDGTAVAGSDYATISGTLTFNAGQTSQSFAVPIINDNIDEDNETINITLSNPTGGLTLGSPSQATLTITDEDAPPTLSFSMDNYNFGEEAQDNMILVTMSPASGKTVTVNYATTAGTATAGKDYTATSGTLTFAPGEVSQVFPVKILADSLDETDETIGLQLTNAVNASNTSPLNSQVTIMDDDDPPTVSFTVSTASVSESAGTVTATVQLSAASGRSITVNYATANGTAQAGSDYTSTSGSLVFAPGETSKTITIPINDDATEETNETFDIILTLPSTDTVWLGTKMTQTVTINANDSNWLYLYMPSLSK